MKGSNGHLCVLERLLLVGDSRITFNMHGYSSLESLPGMVHYPCSNIHWFKSCISGRRERWSLMAECRDNLLLYQRYVRKFVSFNFLFLKALCHNTLSVRAVWKIVEKSSTECWKNSGRIVLEMHLVVQENQWEVVRLLFSLKHISLLGVTCRHRQGTMEDEGRAE